MNNGKERWYLDHMGTMAYWRTVVGIVNLFLALLITIKIFGVI